MPNFGIFHRSKKETETKAEVEEKAIPVSPESKVTESKVPEVKVPEVKTYLRAMPLRDLSDLEAIKSEVSNGNILILRITPLASKSIEDVKKAVSELTEFSESTGGDIARLGEERVVLCPPKVRIWRDKSQVPSEPLPTAA